MKTPARFAPAGFDRAVPSLRRIADDHYYYRMTTTAADGAVGSSFVNMK